MNKVTISKKGKEFRWNIKAGNNKIIASSSEGYINKKDAEKNLFKILDVLIDYFSVPVEEVIEEVKKPKKDILNYFIYLTGSAVCLVFGVKFILDSTVVPGIILTSFGAFELILTSYRAFIK